jgi:DNA-binding PadR family transcriptional regulator
LVQPAILVALTEGPIHGYRLAERIDQMVGMFGGKPDVSGIYRFLKKMEGNGLVASTWQSSDSGHAKRLYEITADGRSCLTRWSMTLETYLKAISNLLDEARAALVRQPMSQPSGT